MESRDLILQIRHGEAEALEFELSAPGSNPPVPDSSKLSHKDRKKLAELQPEDDAGRTRAALATMLDGTPTARRLDAALPRHVDDILPRKRLLIKASQSLHEIPFELLTVPTEDPSDGVVARCPGLTDRWSLVRYSPHENQQRAPSSEPQLLVVLGSHSQPRNATDSRRAVYVMLRTLLESRGAWEFVLAVPRKEREALRHEAEADGAAGTRVLDLVDSCNRTVEVTSATDLEDLLSGGPQHGQFDVVAMIGHSFADVDLNGTRAEFLIDLGPDANPRGLDLDRLTAALGHGATRMFALYACHLTPKVPDQLLHHVDHCVITRGRLDANWAAASLAALLETALHARRTVDEAVHAARHAQPGQPGAWWLQHWTRTLDRSPLVDPVATRLADYLDLVRTTFKSEALETPLRLSHDSQPNEVAAQIVPERVTLWEGDTGATSEDHHRRAFALERSTAAGDRTLVEWIDALRGGTLDGKHSLAVLAAPGAGKTVMLLRTLWKLAQDPEAYWIPVFVRLRRWATRRAAVTPRAGDTAQTTAARSLLQHAAGSIRGMEVGPDDPTVSALEDAWSRGRLLILCDGLDEVTDSDRERIDKRLIALAQKSECPIVVTCRPIGYEAISPVFDTRGLPPFSDRQRASLVARRVGRDMAQCVESRLRKIFEKSATMDRLGRNPLFLSGLADLLARDEDAQDWAIPDLLKEVIEDLLFQKSRGRDARRILEDTDEVIRALAWVAFEMTRRQRLDLVPKWLRGPDAKKHRKALGADWRQARNWEEFLERLAEDTGVMVVREPRLEFRHRALQEWLTASHLHHLYETLGIDEVTEQVGAQPTNDHDEPTERGDTLLQFWVEPCALLAGMLGNGADDWFDRLTENDETLPVALRALVLGAKAHPHKLQTIYQKLDSWNDRAIVYESLREVDGASAVDLARAWAASQRNGNDLWMLRETLGVLEEMGVADASSARQQVFDHLDAPDANTWGWLSDTWWCRRAGEDREFLWKRVSSTEEKLGKSRRFVMGDPGGETAEVCISKPFWAMAVTVTEAMSRVFESAGGADRGTLPRVYSSWFEAMASCAWLNRHREALVKAWANVAPEMAKKLEDDGYGFRLPTEAEWEWMCRAGTTGRYWSGDSLQDPEAKDEWVGWFKENSDDSRHRVGSLRRNPWGLYDVHGNCWEWCLDWYGELEAETDPVGPRRGAYRVMRGGSYWVDAGNCASAFRDDYLPGDAFHYVGFRVVFAPPLPGIEDRS